MVWLLHAYSQFLKLIISIDFHIRFILNVTNVCIYICSIDVYFIRSRKGKLLMIVNEFSFCEESIVKNKIIWRCTSKKGKCRARIHTLGDKMICAKGLHNHPRKPIHPLKPKSPATSNNTSPLKDLNVKTEKEPLEIIKACDLSNTDYKIQFQGSAQMFLQCDLCIIFIYVFIILYYFSCLICINMCLFSIYFIF